MTEIWKDIKGYEGLYQVSNLGEIRRTKTKRIKKATDNGNGYLHITLCKNGERKNYYIHRIVADAFIDNFNNCKEIDHVDYNRKNNNVSNLRRISHKENIRHSIINRKKLIGKDENSNCGERYICKRNNCYEITFKKKYYGRYKTLEKAIEVRNNLIERVD